MVQYLSGVNSSSVTHSGAKLDYDGATLSDGVMLSDGATLRVGSIVSGATIIMQLFSLQDQ